MRESRGSNERNRRKKIVSKAVIAVLTASLVVSGPAASVHADMSGGGSSAVMLTAELPTTININECGLTDGAIKVEFTQNGSYTLTGSNIVDGKYYDATFTVPSGKEVDIYLKGVDIYNGYYLSAGCSSKEAKPVFEIYGTANIHVSSNSSITGLCEMIRVNGVLNFIESTGGATLTVNRSIYGDFYGTYPMISGDDGKVHYKGARVTFVNKVNRGTTDGDDVPCKGHTYIDCDVIPQTEGGPVRFEHVWLTAYRVPGMDSLKLKDDNSKPQDIYKYEVSESTITGLPAGGEVVQLVTLDDKTANPIDNPDVGTRRAVSNLCADSEGQLENVCLPNCVEMYISSEGTVKCYVKNYKSVKEPKSAYKVDFVDKEDTSVSMGSYWVKEGDKVTLLEESGNYNYTYSLVGGTAVAAETTIKADTTIYVTKTAKPKVTITVDDEERQIDYGVTLASAGLKGTYACLETKSIVDLGNTTVTAPITLMKVNLGIEERAGETWFKISSAEELDTFAKLVTEYGITDINGCLTNDINPYNGTMIGSNVLEEYKPGIDYDNSNFFRGSFDGAGHTVRFENNSGNTGTLAGLFGSVSAGAEIKNVITAGTVEGNAQFAGALVASVICQNGDAVKIDNCINTANVIITRPEKDYIGGLVGGKYVDYSSGLGTQVMGLSITNCVNTGQVMGGSGIIGDCMGSSETIISGCINYGENLPITSGKSDYVKVYNSYSTHVDEHESNGKPLPRGTQVTEEAFKSGAVAYLLNSGGSTRTWYQKLGEDKYPKTNGNPNTETVYRGYESCEATTPIYSNTEIAHKEQGHKAGTTYSYAGGKFAVECLYCDKKFTATLNVEDETLSANPKGATVSYSEEWIAAGCPDICIGYAAEEDGEYSETKPVEAGTYYVKASVGEAVACVSYDIRYNCFANDNVIGVIYCMNDGCERHITDKLLTLTLCDYDTVDYKEGEREKFKALFGTDAPQIVFYSEGNLLDAAPEKPGTYTAKATLEYAGESFTAELEFTIYKETKNQPTGLKAVATGSINGSDGKITGVTSEMEYSVDDGKSWNDVTGTEITGLKAGEVFVRYKGDDYYFESSNTSVVVPKHKHSWGTYHEAIQGNCVTKGQIEYWECGSSACNERLDATLNVIEDITGEFDANKHEKTASWVKTAETHKQVYDCCGAEKTAEEAHVYGMEGDARFTCGVCGYVSADTKAAIEENEKKAAEEEAAKKAAEEAAKKAAEEAAKKAEEEAAKKAAEEAAKKAAEEAAKKAEEQNSGSPVIPDISDGGNTGSGSTDSGNTGSGSTDSGNTGSDITGGNTDSGNIEGDNKGDAGNTKESADTDKPDNTDKNTDIDENEAVSGQQKFDEKVDEKVASLKKDLGDDVKVVGASNSFSDAVKATKENSVYRDASGKILKYCFVSDENGNTYFTNKKGKPVKSAVITDGTNMYYCGKKGNVIKNKAFNLPNGERVLASKSGALVTKSNTRVKINGTYYLVKKNGIVAQREIVRSKTGKLLYADKYGVVVTNKTITVKGVKYIADSNGFLKEVTK